MNDNNITPEISAISIAALEYSIDILTDIIKTQHPPKDTPFYKNVQLAKSAKKRWKNNENRIKLSELMITHAALEDMKFDIVDDIRSSETPSEDAQELRSICRQINAALRCLRAQANAYGWDIEAYNSQPPFVD